MNSSSNDSKQFFIKISDLIWFAETYINWNFRMVSANFPWMSSIFGLISGAFHVYLILQNKSSTTISLSSQFINIRMYIFVSLDLYKNSIWYKRIFFRPSFLYRGLSGFWIQGGNNAYEIVQNVNGLWAKMHLFFDFLKEFSCSLLHFKFLRLRYFAI